jgi:hypothetical protein
MSNRTEITRSDILDLAVYEQRRPELRKGIAAAKAKRRMPVGPYATFYFESWDTMHYQIQEMVRAERGGEAQIAEELAAYNPLVPKGTDLVATVMFEINDPQERHRFLSQLGGVENNFFMEVAGTKATTRPERDVERTKADGKTSSVHFIHFELTAEQIAKFKTPGTRVLTGIEHPHYGHVAIMSEETRAELARDLSD